MFLDHNSINAWLLTALALISIILHFWGIRVMKYYRDLAINLTQTANGSRRMIERMSSDLHTTIQQAQNTIANIEADRVLYQTYVEETLVKLEPIIQTPPSQWIFDASIGILTALGASDIGKSEQARQNMALTGLQRIGKAIGKGIKKEIPVIEQLSGGGQSAPGGNPLGGIGESIASSFLGVDLPPGSLSMLMGGPRQVKPQEKKSVDSGIAGR